MVTNETSGADGVCVGLGSVHPPSRKAIGWP